MWPASTAPNTEESNAPCLASQEVSYAISDIFRYSGVIIGSPTYNNSLYPKIAELLSNKKAVAYYDAAHTSRFLFYYPYLLRHHGDDTGRRRLATMYLLTATESLCRAVPNIFGLWSIRLSGWDTVRAMSEQEYVLYQAAKGLYQNHQYISFQELCDRELVDDTALTLILDAMLIAHYGKAMFTIGGTGGEV